MSFGATLRHLGDVVDEWAGNGVTIESVHVSDETDLASGEDVSAVLSLAIDLFDSDGAPPVVVDTTPAVTADDRLAIDLETSLSVGHTEGYDVGVDPGEATLRSDGMVAVTVDLTLPAPADERPDGESTATVGATRQETEYRESESDDRTPAEETPDAASEDLVSATDERDSEGDDRESTRDGEGDSRESSTDGGSRDVPAFKDPALLREVYENHDTFAEMADAIEMDVTGETVRRYMIDCEIHEPNSYRTARTTTCESDDTTESIATDTDATEPRTTEGEVAEPRPTEGETTEPRTTEGEVAEPAAAGDAAAATTEPVRSESPTPAQTVDGAESGAEGEKTLVSDGVGIPDSVDIDELIETVNRSRTIHEVTMDLDFDRAEARNLLQELNLLDLVVGRIDSDPNRAISRKDVIDRLREVSHPEN